jgi:hypothetical protein
MLDKTPGFADTQPFFKSEYLEGVRPDRRGGETPWLSVRRVRSGRIESVPGRAFRGEALRCF